MPEKRFIGEKLRPMNKSYYHITRGVKESAKIAEEGLKASKDGYIYLITRKDVASYVAVFQLGIRDEYGLLKVDPKGIVRAVENDCVGEYPAPYQRRVKQDVIKPKYLKCLKTVRFKKIPKLDESESLFQLSRSTLDYLIGWGKMCQK
jgi:hypothetical protein